MTRGGFATRRFSINNKNTHAYKLPYKTGLIYNKKLDHAYVAYKENFIVGLLDSYHGVGMCATT